jgi:hypothetical protein
MDIDKLKKINNSLKHVIKINNDLRDRWHTSEQLCQELRDIIKYSNEQNEILKNKLKEKVPDDNDTFINECVLSVVRSFPTMPIIVKKKYFTAEYGKFTNDSTIYTYGVCVKLWDPGYLILVEFNNFPIYDEAFSPGKIIKSIAELINEMILIEHLLPKYLTDEKITSLIEKHNSNDTEDFLKNMEKIFPDVKFEQLTF